MKKIILLFTSFIIIQISSNISKAIDFGDNAYDRITAFIGFNIFGGNSNIENSKKTINSGQFLIGASYDGYIHMLDKKFDLMFGLEIGGNINIKNNNNFIEQNTIIQHGKNILNTEINDYTARLDIIKDNNNALLDILPMLSTIYTLTLKDYIQYIEEKYTETLLPNIAEDILKLKQQYNSNIVNLKDFNDYYLTYNEAYKEYFDKTNGNENDKETKNKATIYAMLKTGLTPDEIKSADYSNDPFAKYEIDSVFIKTFKERQTIIDNNNSFIENNLKDVSNEFLIEKDSEITFKNTSVSSLIEKIHQKKQEFENNNNGQQAIIMLRNYGYNDSYTSWDEAYSHYFEITGDTKEDTEAQNKATIYAMLKTGLTPDEIKSADYSNDPFEQYINNGEVNNTTSTYNTNYSIYEKFHSVARIGAKYNFINKVSLQIYCPIGLNVAQIIKTDTKTDRKSVVGFTTGVGADAIINENFAIGIEYRYAYNKYEKKQFNTHILQIKFGIRFL